MWHGLARLIERYPTSLVGPNAEGGVLVLTYEGHQNRWWQTFPMLRRALEGKPRPLRPTDFLTSVDEGPMERMGRLLDIAMTAAELPEQVWDVAWVGEPDQCRESKRQVQEEISHLISELAASSRMLSDVGDSLLRLRGIIDRPERPAPPRDESQ
jgi:hypothetical protein